MLDESIMKQVASLIPLIKRPVEFHASLDDSPRSQKLREMLEQVAALSDQITLREKTDERTPSFAIVAPGTEIQIRFAGIPIGHELPSFMLALVQVGGHPPRISEETRQAIINLDTELNFTTYLSLSCQNCPDVVQSLNTMAVLNPKISHTAVEGGAFQTEIETLGIKSVPTVMLNGEMFEQGRMELDQVLSKLDEAHAKLSAQKFNDLDPFDMLILGGGPAGAASAIYGARKGLRVGLAAQRLGGQVLDTGAIENLIALPTIQGEHLGRVLEENAKSYGVEILTPLNATGITPRDDSGLLTVHLGQDVSLKAKTTIIATGASYRTLGVPGEDKYRTRGVTFCPHCDGPLFEGQTVAVVGGGNSGMEAAIDLAGITTHVTVVERLPECQADAVLMRKAQSLDNLDIITNAEVTEVVGNGQVVTGLRFIDHNDSTKHEIALQGIFVQIGLVPNTAWMENTNIARNERGEVIADSRGNTSMPGVYAAGDCADTAYKQILVALGSGATAALAAFDELIRQTS